MREGLPSLTAAAVSLFRGSASLPGSKIDFVNDRGMRVLAPRSAQRAFDALGTLTARWPRIHDALAAPTAGLLTHVALRTAAIDAAVRHETSRPLPQLVILGAGLDARAFRMPELASTIVYEVDFPSTQTLKKARARELTAAAREVRFVPIDFERESLEDVLTRAGHRTDLRTVWIWEGVTMYLDPAAMEATLRMVSARSANGSALLMTYSTPDLAPILDGALAPVAPLVDFAFGLLGEPLRGRMSKDEAHALLKKHGLVASVDTGSPEWAAAHLRGRPSRIVIGERLVRAVRGPEAA
jgi:methyltransferase (TIGR00027 family)